jgi:putative nucleotidyltransferase with HDIG domain
MDTIKNLVLSVNTFASFEGCKFPGFTLEGLWTHSLEVGHLARQIIELEYLPRSFGQESLIAGLLHDIGKLVLAVNMPGGYETALQLAQKESLPMHRAEEMTLGVNHAEVGGYILSLWGLPGRVVDAVAYHHEPERLGATFLNPAVAVFLANAAVHRMTSGDAVRVDESRLQFLTSLDIGEALLCWIYANV